MPAKVRRQLIIFLVMVTVTAAALAAGPAGAERLRIIPVPPNVAAQWTPMPDLPQVSHAPNLPTDVFRHRGRYYFYWEGIWYQSKKIKGPWTRLDHPPAILSRIQTAYFKTLPRGGAKPPATPAPGLPPGEGLVTPEGTPAVPPPVIPEPAAPVPPAPPAEGSAPPPQAVPSPEPVTPPQPPETGQAPDQATPPETAPPGEQAAPPSDPQESAPLAVPEGPMPKAM